MTAELKTNTVKHVYSVSISSETESFQTVVTAESMSEALRIVAERRSGLDRSNLSMDDRIAEIAGHHEG